MRTRSVLALVMGYPLLSGCVQGPPLQYTAFSDGGSAPQGDYAGLTKFTLARSLLLVQASAGERAQVTSVPSEAVGDGTDFGIREVPGTAGTALQLTKIGNSNLVSSLALHPTARASSSDNATVPLALPASGPAFTGLAFTIDTQALLPSARPERVPMSGIVEGAGRQLAFDIVFDPVPADAIETRHLDLQRTGSLYFYSACRTATLTILSAPLAQQRFTVTVADPNFVQTIAVDENRTIASHSACGVDVLANGAGGIIRSGGVADLVAQARSLSTSWRTTPMSDSASALAAVKPLAPPKRSVRKASRRTPAQVPPAEAEVEAPAQAEATPRNPLRNAEIRLPVPDRRESFAF
ncbi:hypothetical protein [Pseudomonas japonica]|uniref:hypothetical protein n=1 Tax=Pseudomonas japonica TaxID=256466 RepID=UPI0015E412B7|nr:hypothetical protein [Pseudomonas japonica]MBA1242318.1 hypothetical protein [Pseudomonas japonica]